MSTPKRTRTKPTKAPTAYLDPHGEEFAYVVAKFAWSEGLAANAIVRRLDLDSTPLNLMHVKRALKRAQKYLTLHPPEETELATRLDRAVNTGRKVGVKFTVVQDDLLGEGGTMFGVVTARAAELVTEIVSELARRPVQPNGPQPDIVIGNAGGRTISEMVRALRRSPPLTGGTDGTPEPFARRAVVIAGNAGYLPTLFNRSANFLSVTLAELFGAEHMALPFVSNDEFLKEYRTLVKRMSLFICGVGTAEDGLARRHFRTRGVPFPAEAVGDLAFHLLDREGQEVRLSAEAQKFMAEVNPVLSVADLRRIGRQNRLLLVLDSEKPLAKLDVSIAALRGEYATDVVLGSQLAKAILQKYDTEGW